jgi:DNA (cytosine-5)-methyltransferase 1
MKRTDLKNSAHISSNVLARLGRDESVSIESLEKICFVLKCDIGDILEFTENEKA